MMGARYSKPPSGLSYHFAVNHFAETLLLIPLPDSSVFACGAQKAQEGRRDGIRRAHRKRPLYLLTPACDTEKMSRRKKKFLTKHSWLVY